MAIKKIQLRSRNFNVPVTVSGNTIETSEGMCRTRTGTHVVPPVTYTLTSHEDPVMLIGVLVETSRGVELMVDEVIQDGDDESFSAWTDDLQHVRDLFFLTVPGGAVDFSEVEGKLFEVVNA